MFIEEQQREAAHWCAQELGDVDFGDRRLNARFVITAQKLAEQPGASINKACENWATTKAAYRLFENERVEASEILKVHSRKTAERCQRQPEVILAIQDTTYLNYGSHWETEGLGPIAGSQHEKQTGLIAHTTLAVSSSGIPLGILDQRIWARNDGEVQKKLGGDFESHKWLASMETVCSLLGGGARAIVVADREADITDWLELAQRKGISFLVRAMHNRLVINANAVPLWVHMNDQPIRGQYTVEAAVKPSKKAARKVATRTAEVSVRYAEVQFRVAAHAKKPWLPVGAIVEAVAIFVKEEAPPEGMEPVEWMLITGEKIESYEDALEKIGWYKQRWHIENFHRVLKSGCRIESCLLSTAEKLEKYITLLSVIAWRLYWMIHVSRVEPELSCEQILAPPEWQALYCKIHKTREPPIHPPTTRQAIHWIASLGGFLGRKGDGEPGVKTTWEGWRRLTDIVEDWLIFSGRSAASG